MAAFSFEEGMLTDVLFTICALRTRVNISAMGSLMLMYFLLPAGFGHAGHFAAHRHFAKFVACEAKLAEYATRTTGNDAAIALASRVRIAGQLLQLQTCLIAFFVGLRLIVDDRLERCAFGGKFFCQLGALDVAIDE